MTKPISRPMHGLITDYPYVVLVGAAPAIAGFADNAVATALCRVLSGGILASSLLTRAEWGLVRVFPYKAHLAADISVGVFALLAPYLFGFAHNTRARNTLMVAGLFGVLAGTLSQPDEMPTAAPPQRQQNAPTEVTHLA